MVWDAFALILLMLGLGMVLGRTTLLPANASETLNLVVLYVCLPAAVLLYRRGCACSGHCWAWP